MYKQNYIFFSDKGVYIVQSSLALPKSFWRKLGKCSVKLRSLILKFSRLWENVSKVLALRNLSTIYCTAFKVVQSFTRLSTLLK